MKNLWVLVREIASSAPLLSTGVLLLIFSIQTAMKLSEQLSLTYENVDLTNNTL